MRRRTRRSVSTQNVGMTPLWGVVCILLIFFMVTTLFIKELALDRNQASQARADLDETAVTIRIGQNGQIFVQSRPVGIGVLRSAGLEAALAAGNGPGTVIIAERRVNAGLMVSVLDQARLSGIDDISLAAKR